MIKEAIQKIVDKPKALYWYDRASDQGHGGAMLGCALLYYQGEGVAKNNAKSKAYFKKSRPDSGPVSSAGGQKRAAGLFLNRSGENRTANGCPV